MDPSPSVRWAFADSLPDSALDDAIRDKTLFMDWFNTEILPPATDPAQCSSALLLYIGSDGTQTPRNEYFADPPPVPFGFSPSRISPLSECPDSVFPVGEFAEHSDITDHDEFFPVTVDVMAAKGCDGLLAKLANDLVEAGILTQPKAGGSLAGGDILLRRALHVQ